MIRISAILLLGVVVCYSSNAEKIKGYYIAEAHDTVHVTFDIQIRYYHSLPDFVSLQSGVYYFDPDNKKHFLDPVMAVEISFCYKKKNIRILSMPFNISLSGKVTVDTSQSANMFLHCIRDGKIKLFKYYRDSNPSDHFYTYGEMIEDYIFHKENGISFIIDKIFFRKKILSQISDCPDLENKYSKKIFRYHDIKKICEEYNTICNN